MLEVPGYDLVRKLQEDLATQTFEAIERTTGATVVLRTHRTERASAEEALRLQHGYELARRVEVRGVLRGLALVSRDGRVAQISEPLDETDEPLRPLVDDRTFARMEWREALTIAVGLAETIAELHAVHVVHNNLTPASIFVSRQSGAVKLAALDLGTDLGGALVQAAGPEHIEGDLRYTSPERTGRMNRGVDARADIYSLGVCLFELFTGELPFTAREPLELLHAHLAQKPRTPSVVRPGLPRVLDDILLTCLQKEPDERYQSASGLAHDLRACANAVAAGLPLDDVHLRERDAPTRFEVSRQVYGRDAQREQLRAAFALTSAGAKALVTISGYSGIGKTSLVHELHNELTARRASFTSGKFDQLGGETPFAPLGAALDALLQRLLREPDNVIATWRAQLRAALGKQAALLAPLLPSLERVLGRLELDTQAPTLSFAEAQHRFHAVLSKLVGVFATLEHPLVLFFDDLQWADPGSLQALQLWMTDEALGSLLLICAYRENEVDALHPASVALRKIAQHGTPLEAIELRPLDEDALAHMVASTFRGDVARARPLARLLHQKTLGNPFFAARLLMELHSRGLISWHAREGRWVSNDNAIARVDVPDSVVDLLRQRIDALEPEERRLLTLAAALGNSFELDDLAPVAGLDVKTARARLDAAVAQGLLMMPLASHSGGRFKFVHDRMQQAAYEHIADDEKRRVHRRIGELLLEGCEDEDDVEANIFDIASHLNLARALEMTEADRLRLADLNRRAGRRALRAAAHANALAHLVIARELLPPTFQTTHRALAYDVSFHLAHALYIEGKNEECEATIEALLQLSPSDDELLELAWLRIKLEMNLMRPARAIEAFQHAMGLLGVRVPSTATEKSAEATRDRERLLERVRVTSFSALAELPPMTDASARRQMALLISGLHAANFADVALYTWIAQRMCALSIDLGVSEESAQGFSAAGFSSARAFDDTDTAYELGRVGTLLAERSQDPRARCATNMMMAFSISSWREHVRVEQRYAQLSLEAGRECGDRAYFVGGIMSPPRSMFFAGEPLVKLREKARANLQVQLRFQPLNAAFFHILVGAASALLAESAHPPTTLAPDDLTEEALAANMKQVRLGQAPYFFALVRAELALLFDDPAAAHASMQLASSLFSVVTGMAQSAEHWFLRGLVCARLLADAAWAHEHDVLRAQLDADLARLERAAKFGRQNFAHKALFLRGEKSRVDGNLGDAFLCFDKALVEADREGFLHVVGLLHERSAALAVQEGLEARARLHVSRALDAYGAWGAVAKVEHVRKAFEALVPASGPRAASDDLDARAVFSGAQDIARETRLEGVVRKIMRTTMQVSGADRGALVTMLDGRVRVPFVARADDTDAPWMPERALDDVTTLPHGLIRFVLHTARRTITDELGDYASDPDVAARRTKSMLAAPIVNQGRVVGVVYLENGLVRGAFHGSRLDAVEILSAQAGVSMESARLLATLEQKVEERTLELQSAQARVVELERAATETQMAGGFAHELRNALGAASALVATGRGAADQISLFAQNAESLEALYGLVEARIPSDDTERSAADLAFSRLVENELLLEELFGGIELAIGRSLRIIKEILAFGQLGQQRVTTTAFDVAALLHEVVREIVLPTDHIELALPALGTASLRSAPVHLRHLLENVVRNSVDALRGVSGRPRRLTLGVQPVADGIDIEVVDTGIGMSEATQRRAFEPFFSTKLPTGTGLGLSVVRRLAFLLGGSVTLESTHREGTRVVVHVPNQPEA